MSSLDEITLEEAAARRRREVRVATVRPHWCEESRCSQYWCDACGSPSCQHVLELVTTGAPCDSSMALDDFTTYAFTYRGQRRTIYRRETGPGSSSCTSCRGSSRGVVRFADFTVFMPHLFGVPGKPLTRGYLYTPAIRVCLRREFHALAARKSRPVTEWLRGLCRHAHQAGGGPGVGVVGMCFTGGFALAMMLPAVMAPVVCQPVLPMFACTRDRARDLARGTRDSQGPGPSRDQSAGPAVHQGSALSPGEVRYPPPRAGGGLRGGGDRFVGGQPARHPFAAHAVLTDDFVDRDGHPTREALYRS